MTGAMPIFILVTLIAEAVLCKKPLKSLMPNRNYLSGRKLEWQRRAYWESCGYGVIRSAGSKSPYDLVLYHPYKDVCMVQVKRVASTAQAKRLCEAFYKRKKARAYTQLLEVFVPRQGIHSAFVEKAHNPLPAFDVSGHQIDGP